MNKKNYMISFGKIISIVSILKRRQNVKLHVQYLPKRYWRYLNENMFKAFFDYYFKIPT